MKLQYLENPTIIPLGYSTAAKGERTFIITEAIEVTLSDGHIITIKKGFKTDLSSVPKWLWSLIRPMDVALLGDIIHDHLWVLKAAEIKRLDNSFAARKFADKERLKWRKHLAPKKKFKNWITHVTIRLIGGFFYSHQLKIPS